MCGKVDQAESMTCMLGVLGCLYEDHPEDAALLMNLYFKDCKERGAEGDCVMGSMISTSLYLTMNLLGPDGGERVKDMSMWWAAQCH